MCVGIPWGMFQSASYVKPQAYSASGSRIIDAMLPAQISNGVPGIGLASKYEVDVVHVTILLHI